MFRTHCIRTPNLSHVKVDDWDLVYEPSEDTFFFIDVLEDELDFIYTRKPQIVLEVGSGSGSIITALSSVLSSSCYCLAVDINPYACKMTSATARHNHVNVDVVQSNLTYGFQRGKFDLVVFNPPYVVTPSHEVESPDLLTRAWAGGQNGREVIDRFINDLHSCVSDTGFGYLLLLKENKPTEVSKYLREKQFVSRVVGRRKIRGEELSVLRFERASSLNC